MNPALFGVALNVLVAAGGAPVPTLPLDIPDAHFSPLRESVDLRLQGRLDRALRAQPSWKRLIERKRMAVGLVDLTDPAQPRFARVNGDVELYAASLPKIAILLAAFQAIEDGELVRTTEVDRELNDMIRISDNPAATKLIDRIGLDRIERAVTDPRYRFYDPAAGGGLWVGKRYGVHGERHGDPLNDLSHAATVTQTCRFYYQLAAGRVISRDASREMLEILADPGLNHKFVKSVAQRAPWARLFRKSGTWRQHHADSVIVWGERWRRYILVAIIEDNNGERILQDLVPVVEDRVLRNL